MCQHSVHVLKTNVFITMEAFITTIASESYLYVAMETLPSSVVKEC